MPRLLHILLGLLLLSAAALAEGRFPPPDFEGGYKIPSTATPPPRGDWLQILDAGVLIGALGIALWLIYRKRSRRGIMALSLFSLGYFGFYRAGCVCAIGSVQNVALALFDSRYALPITVLIFFLAPLLVALFAGRAFCAAVCPQGAIQDLVLVKANPVKVPPWLEQSLGLIPFFFLGAGAIFAATGSGFIICRFDPLVPFFRFNGSTLMLALGAAFLIIGTVVGRPYCRFLCPYSALLRMTSAVSKWRVRVTPDTCTQCSLCQQSCPFGALREPSAPEKPAERRADRKRIGRLILLLPVLIAVGAFAGFRLGMTEWAIHHHLERASLLFGGWVGLVIGVKLLLLSARRARTDFEPDPSACVGCARCFETCPSERIRRGILPAELEATDPK